MTSDKDNAVLDVLVSSISELVKTYCGNSFVDYYSTNKIEYFNVESGAKILQLTESPIVQLVSVEERTSPTEAYVVLTSADYYLDSFTDSLFRVPLYWTEGPGAAKITYKAGYATTPADLKLAVFDLITYYYKEEYKERRTIGGTSITNQVSSTQWRNVDFPDHIKRVLDLYRHM